MNINQWAMRWNIPAEALDELLSMSVPDSQVHAGTEAAVQQDIRLSASYNGRSMWRNNNGAATTEDGRHLRFGLGNDSARINKVFKSSDLIGITPMIIRASMIGRAVGVFTAIEVKAGSWKWSGSDREQAQWKYLQLVNRMGGIGAFAKSVKDYESCLIEHG